MDHIHTSYKNRSIRNEREAHKKSNTMRAHLGIGRDRCRKVRDQTSDQCGLPFLRWLTQTLHWFFEALGEHLRHQIECLLQALHRLLEGRKMVKCGNADGWLKFYLASTTEGMMSATTCDQLEMLTQLATESRMFGSYSWNCYCLVSEYQNSETVSKPVVNRTVQPNRRI